MSDPVIRYVVTHMGKNGLRTLCGPAQGRVTKETAEEAQALLDAMMTNNRVDDNGLLAGVYGLPLEVRSVPCYPGHFDPMRVYFDGDFSDDLMAMRGRVEKEVEMAKEKRFDLNVFSTDSARHTWQMGWDGKRPANLVDGSPEWRYWMRGSIAHELANGAPGVADRPRA